MKYKLKKYEGLENNISNFTGICNKDRITPKIMLDCEGVNFIEWKCESRMQRKVEGVHIQYEISSYRQ
jgi:hypothetical protein